MSEQELTPELVAELFGARKPEPPADPELAANGTEQAAQDLSAGLFGKHTWERALVQMLHGPPDEPAPVVDDGAPDFDGGVREPAPGPTDPAADHDQLIAELMRNAPSGGQW